MIYVVFARQERGGRDWFLGAVTDENGRQLEIPLDFLEPGVSYRAQIYRDGPGAHWESNPYSITIEEKSLGQDDVLALWLAPGGGAAIRFVAGDSAMRQKPRLSFWQIWNMCFGFLGIQFGFALQNANVSRIFQTLGAEIDDLPILWVAAPLTGLIVQPIIGYLSDRTWNRLGRRRPYFLGGAILASLALLVMPNSPYLWVAAGMLWIMDASINISMEPFRAFVGDNLPKPQRTLGFAMQSFFIGIGAIVASALPWMMANWFEVSNMADPARYRTRSSGRFTWVAGYFSRPCAWTVFSTREYSPEEIAEFEAADENVEVVRSARTAVCFKVPQRRPGLDPCRRGLPGLDRGPRAG